MTLTNGDYSDADVAKARQSVESKYNVVEDFINEGASDTLFDTNESFDGIDDYLDSLYHKQINVPKSTYNRVIASAESANQNIIREGEELPKFNAIIDGKTMYVYMNFDDQGLDINEILVDRFRIGSRTYNDLSDLIKESYQDEFGSSDETGKNELQGGLGIDQALRRIGGTKREADRVHNAKSESVGERVPSKGAGVSQYNTDDTGRTKDSGLRGRGLSTDNGAFSLPDKGTRYYTDISFDAVTPIEDTPYAAPMYYK